MTVNRKVTGTASTIPEGLAVGVFMALAAMFSGSLITAMLIHQEIMDWEHMPLPAESSICCMAVRHGIPPAEPHDKCCPSLLPYR